MRAMTETPAVDRAQAKEFYEDFSPMVGTADWTRLNDRHEQLKLFVTDVLNGARDLRILDLGCGTGVLTAHLRRYGTVTGIDLSSNAVAIARQLVPGVEFRSGSLDAVDPSARFDLITMFDVLEHIPETERPALLAQLAGLLAPHGRVFASTPYPDYTEWRRARGAEDLQIVDESVRLEEVAGEAVAAGLTVLRYQAFDLWGGTPEYQFFVFGGPPVEPGGPARLRERRLDWRMRLLAGPRARLVVKLWRAARLLRHGHLAAARWTMRPEHRAPPSRES